MTAPLRIFIGYDSKEPVAYHVLSHSILTRSSYPVSIIPLRQDTLRQAGIYTRERGPTESTEFSLTRFLVPYLSGYEGYSVFMDSDMLCRVDICDLYAEIALQLHEVNHTVKAPIPPVGTRNKAVLCCQHDYTPSETVKFLGNQQTVYPRKNWSSLMVFANDACKALTPEYVNTASGLDLHRFNWLDDAKIGSLPLTWNWLVGEYGYDPACDYPWSYPAGDTLMQTKESPKILHWTKGGPWFDEYRKCDHAAEWQRECDALLMTLSVSVAA